MAVRLQFDFHGDEQVTRRLLGYAERARDATPVWNRLADRLVASETEQFDTEGRHASAGWAPLSATYAAWKARHYPGKPILQRTGDLVQSLTRRPLDVEVIEPGFMVLGTAVHYARYHQHGTEHMPRRRPLELTEAERREWVRELQRHIVTGDDDRGRGGEA